MPRPCLRPTLGALAAGLACLACLATGACSMPAPRSAASSTSAPRTTSDLAAIRVTGGTGGTPNVSVPTPFSVASSTRRVLATGSGAVVKAGQRVTVDYLGIDGTDGHQILSSYGDKPPTFVLDPKQAMPGIVTSLVGVPVGSRVLAALAPKDAYGVRGQPAAGIGPTDTIVVLLDVRSARTVLTRATGTPVAPRAGLPVVRVDASGTPVITLPKGNPPADLIVQPLIAGRGPKVSSGQQLRVQYLGVIWPGGREFDSSWRRGEPATITVGRGQVVGGLDRGLLGQTVGSRVLLVVPPDDGYGAAGNTGFGVRGTDTLVFVVDILDAS